MSYKEKEDLEDFNFFRSEMKNVLKNYNNYMIHF